MNTDFLFDLCESAPIRGETSVLRVFIVHHAFIPRNAIPPSTTTAKISAAHITH
jgi:hypothetical protein